jgi:hypothetical protein
LKYFRLARGIRILGATMLFVGVISWLIVTQNAQNSQFDPEDTQDPQAPLGAQIIPAAESK